MVLRALLFVRRSVASTVNRSTRSPASRGKTATNADATITLSRATFQPVVLRQRTVSAHADTRQIDD